MSKINVLVVPSDRFGSGKFRSVDPHVNLSTEDFFVDINYEVDWNNDEFLNNFQIIHIHRQILPDFTSNEAIIKKLTARGIKVVVDTDDYWQLDTHHQHYELFNKNQLGKHIIAGMRAATVVTCPTPYIADELRKIGIKHVAVLPNAINTNEAQFKPNPSQSERMRFGWLGGSSHLFDMEQLASIPYRGQDFGIVLCGYDTSGKVKLQDPKTGQIKQRDVSPVETVWFQYEIFMTDGFEILREDKDYFEFLLRFVNLDYQGVENKPYRRIWTRAVNQYAKGYNEFDVALAPLKDTKFNLFKSQLKAIEAGFMKKALIASDFGPYQQDLVHGKNALLVKPNKSHKQWRQHVERLTKNPNMVTDLAEALHETVKDKYSLSTVNATRTDLYKLIGND